MNVLILGDGAEEAAWARWLIANPAHRLDATFPGFDEPEFAGIPVPVDLEDALARPGLDLAIVGGPLGPRGEWLRRAAAEGFAIIALHPPGTDSEAYYQVALSREETGATIVPDLPLRHHPGMAAIRRAYASGELGTFRGLRVESSPADESAELVRDAFSTVVDAVRSILGEVESLTATGDPPGMDPSLELVVQLRAAGSLRAEVRVRPAVQKRLSIALEASSGSLSLELTPDVSGSSRLIRQPSNGALETVELPPWDAHAAILAVLAATLERRDPSALPAPNLLDGTRAMELAEAVNRSLRRDRTVELHYESISEENTFKSVMTSTGCMVFLIMLFVLPIAMVGPAVGVPWTLYLPALILPALIVFMLIQSLGLAIGRRRVADARPKEALPRTEKPIE